MGAGIANAVIVRWNQLGSTSRRGEETCTKSGSQSFTVMEVFERVMRDLPGWSSEAEAKLDVTTIIDEFPKTWALRASAATAAATARSAEPGGKKPPTQDWENDLLKCATAWKDGRALKSGKVNIFPAVDAGPVQVVRFACAILKEYAEREKLDYTLTLKV